MTKRKVNNLKYVLGAIAIVVVAVGVPVVRAQFAGGGNYVNNAENVYQTVNAPEGISEPVLGAVSGPDYTWRYQSHNGVTTFYEKEGVTKATSTVCSLRPIESSSTTTLESFRFKITGSTLGANDFALATSTDPYNATSSTNSIISTYSVPSNVLDTMSWNAPGSLGVGILVEPVIISPGEWIVWKIATSTPGSNGYTGTCSATFKGF